MTSVKGAALGMLPRFPPLAARPSAGFGSQGRIQVLMRPSEDPTLDGVASSQRTLSVRKSLGREGVTATRKGMP